MSIFVISCVIVCNSVGLNCFNSPTTVPRVFSLRDDSSATSERSCVGGGFKLPTLFNKPPISGVSCDKEFPFPPAERMERIDGVVGVAGVVDVIGTFDEEIDLTRFDPTRLPTNGSNTLRETSLMRVLKTIAA